MKRRIRVDAVVAGILLLAVAAAPEPVFAAKTIVVTSTDDQRGRNKPAPAGSLREAIELAEPGDTITFNVSGPVVLRAPLLVPARLSRLTIQGPAVISSATRGIFEVLADHVTIQQLRFENIRLVGGTPALDIFDLRLLDNTVAGTSTVSFDRVNGCQVSRNTFDVSGAGSTIGLDHTVGCELDENVITGAARWQIFDAGSEGLIIDGNRLNGGIRSTQHSGIIRNNQLTGEERMRIGPYNMSPSGPLQILDNQMPGMVVQRTNVEIVGNALAPFPGAALAAALLRVVIDPLGAAGNVRIERNTLRGGRTGIYYSGDTDFSSTVTLFANIVSDCRGTGLLLNGRLSRVDQNEIYECDAGIELVTPLGADLRVERNTVLRSRGPGVRVTNVGERVTMVGNTIRESAAAGVRILGGAGITNLVSNLIADNRGHGVSVGNAATASIQGDQIRRNGGAGVHAERDTAVSISQVSMDSNAGPGIDNAPAGVTANDRPTRVFLGPHYPEAFVWQDGTVTGTAEPRSVVEWYRVEVGPRAGNPRNGEGATFVGSTIADAAGRFTYSFSCVAPTLMTAIATLRDSSGARASTSEFSEDTTCVPPPPTDGDLDGVLDPADRCPNTPAGAPVNADGCAASQLDDDSDGVNNAADNCPGIANPDQTDGDGDAVGDACDPDLVSVPDVRGLTRLTAQTVLAAAGLFAGDVRLVEGAVAGSLSDQTPAPGARVALGTAVNLSELFQRFVINGLTLDWFDAPATQDAQGNVSGMGSRVLAGVASITCLVSNCGITAAASETEGAVSITCTDCAGSAEVEPGDVTVTTLPGSLLEAVVTDATARLRCTGCNATATSDAGTMAIVTTPSGRSEAIAGAAAITLACGGCSATATTDLGQVKSRTELDGLIEASIDDALWRLHLQISPGGEATATTDAGAIAMTARGYGHVGVEMDDTIIKIICDICDATATTPSGTEQQSASGEGRVEGSMTEAAVTLLCRDCGPDPGPLVCESPSPMSLVADIAFALVYGCAGGRPPYQVVETTDAFVGGAGVGACTGLTVTVQADGSIVVQGNPTTLGPCTPTFQVSDSSATTRFTMIQQHFEVYARLTAEATATTLPGDVNTALHDEIRVSGGSGQLTYEVVSGALPPGVVLDGNVVTGTPTQGGRFKATIEIRDRLLTSQVVRVEVFMPVLEIEPTIVPDATVGQSYALDIVTRGRLLGSWSVLSGELPQGMSFHGIGLAEARLEGSPTRPGTYTFTVVAEQRFLGGAISDTQELTIVVREGEPQCAVRASGPYGNACGDDPTRFSAGEDIVQCSMCRIQLAGGGTMISSREDSAAVVTSARASCSNCELVGEGTVLAPEPPADPQGPPSQNQITVEGEWVEAAGRSEVRFPNSEPAMCPDTRPCVTVLPRALIGNPTLQHAEIIIEKVTIDGDGEFRFHLFSEQNDGRRITTSGRRGTSTIRYVGTPFQPPTEANPLPDIVLFFGETGTPGWKLEGIDCPPFTAQPVDGLPGAYKVRLTAGDSVVCRVTNRKLPVTVVRPVGPTLPHFADETGTFGLPAGNRITIAGSNGLEIRDAVTDQIPTAGNQLLSFLDTGSPYADLYGALVVKHPSGDGSDALFTYGSGGTSVRQFFPATGDFGFIQVSFPPGQNVTDATYFGDDPNASGALSVNFTTNRVRAHVWRDFGELVFAETANLVTSANVGFGTGMVSAFTYDLRFDPDGELLPESTGWIATLLDGTPGRLWISNPQQPGALGTLVAVVGDSPRRVRCLVSHNLCAVSNFDSDSLTIVQWNGRETAAIAATQPVGDGPVGIDLRADGVNAKVISTGFNDHTFTVTTLSPSGAVLSSVTQQVPGGCVNPGHALWLSGVPGTAVVTCKGSNAYALITP